MDGLATAISQIGNAVYSEEDGEFVIRPVLDLSDIQNGVGAIGGMFASAGDLRLAGRVSASMARYGKSGTTTVTVKSDDVVKELRQLREDMSNWVTGSVSCKWFLTAAPWSVRSRSLWITRSAIGRP